MAEPQVRGNSRVPAIAAREAKKNHRIAGFDSVSGRGKKFKGVYDKGKKWLDRLERFKKILNEETRPAQVFQEGLNLVEYVLEKILKGATKHPYWKLHEAHFKVLKAAIQATTSVEMAQQEQQKAISIALEITERAKLAKRDYALKGGRGRGRELKEIHDDLVAATLARRMSAAYDQFQADLWKIDSKIFDLYVRREELINVLFGEFALLEIDQKLVEESMRLYKEKLDKMREAKDDFGLSKNFANIRENRGQLEEYLAISGSSKGHATAISAAIGGVGSVYQLARDWARELDKQDVRLESLRGAD
jgi:hypothetical protein